MSSDVLLISFNYLFASILRWLLNVKPNSFMAWSLKFYFKEQ